MKDKIKLFMKASRSRVLPVIIIPVLLGAAAAFAWNDAFHPLLFIVTVIGAAAAHLFSNMINDLWDYRNGVDGAAKETAAAISTNSGMLANGAMSEKAFAARTWSLFGIAALSGALLTAASGWPVLLFGGLGALIAYSYVAPPIKFGYRGKGYSELAILLSFGVLPVMGSYYVQTSELDVRALLISLPVGLLTTLVLFNHHFLHWRADERSGKKTLVVVWGERGAIRFSIGLLALSYVSLIACVAAGALPWYALIAIVTAYPIASVYRTLKETNPSPAYLPLMGASVKASVRCGFLLVVALLVQAWV